MATGHNGQGPGAFRKVLVPLDGSTLAEQVLPVVTELAIRFSSKLVLLSVIQTPRTSISSIDFGPVVSELSIDEERALVEAAAARARSYLETAAKSLRDRGLQVQYVTERGSPGEGIVRYAKANEVDLIAIATHGRSGLRRLVFGSVADQVLRESGLPILLIRPELAKS